jgi:hypothetical protein
VVAGTPESREIMPMRRPVLVFSFGILRMSKNCLSNIVACSSKLQSDIRQAGTFRKG